MHMYSYLVAIVSYKYAQNPGKIFANRKAIDSRTAPAVGPSLLCWHNSLA